MIEFDAPAAVPAGFGPSAVTIGKFDGVHLGHREIIAQLRAVAAARSLASAVVTFDRNPLATVRPERCPASLTGTAQKRDLLAETGVDASLVLRFDRAMAEQSPEEFVREILVDALHARAVLVGQDFRFGHRGRGDTEMLARMGAEYGFELVVIPDVVPEQGRRVSSTWVRELLADGDVAAAARLLGRPHAVRGEVVHGAKRGRELGFPTANLEPASQGFIPADGVYAGWLEARGVRYAAAISVGNNPTFEGVPQKQVEANLPGVEVDLYGAIAEIEFVERIRGMVAFAGIEPLIAQMGADVRRMHEILAV